MLDYTKFLHFYATIKTVEEEQTLLRKAFEELQTKRLWPTELDIQKGLNQIVVSSVTPIPTLNLLRSLSTLIRDESTKKISLMLPEAHILDTNDSSSAIIVYDATELYDFMMATGVPYTVKYYATKKASKLLNAVNLNLKIISGSNTVEDKRYLYIEKADEQKLYLKVNKTFSILVEKVATMPVAAYLYARLKQGENNA